MPTPPAGPSARHDAHGDVAGEAPTSTTPSSSWASIGAWGLTSVMTAAALAGHLTVVATLDLPTAPLSIPWWGVAVAMLAAELTLINVPIGRDAHTFTLNELPLILGLVFASPAGLIVGRQIAVAGTMAVRGPRTARKVLFNLALAYLEVVTGLVVYAAVLGPHMPTSVQGGLAALVVAVSTQLLGALAVASMIALHTGCSPFDVLVETFLPSTITYVGLASVAIVSTFVLWEDPQAGVFLVVLAAFVFVLFHVYKTLRQRHDDLKSVYAFTRDVDAAEVHPQPEHEVLRSAMAVMRCDLAELYLVGGSAGASGTGAGGDGRFARITSGGATEASRADDAAVGARLHATMETIRGVVSLDVLAEMDADLAATFGDAGFETALLCTLDHDDRRLGVLVVGNRNGPDPRFTTDDARLLQTLAHHAGATLERQGLFEQLRYEAVHDELTGLSNRSHFLHTVDALLAERRRGDPSIAVLLMDLDRFKDVNDTLGHHAGDRLLQQVSERLSAVAGPSSVVARLGGDEFAVVLQAGDVIDAMAAASRIHASIEHPFGHHDVMLQVGLSIGISIGPEQGTDATTLLQRADVAMYAAKEAGRDCELYDASLDKHSVRQLALGAALRQAIEAGSLEVAFQPQARASDGVVVGVEALARWTHPDLGVVRPDEFVAIAEQTGSIKALTWHVLRTAITALQDLGDDSLTVSVNVSTRTLLDQRLPVELAELLTELSFPPARLVIELTETTLMSDNTRVAAVLDALETLGVMISIDDFGTGYSSLAYLPRVPATEIKIDRSFVMRMLSSPADAAIVRTAIDLAGRLGLVVVAEGVETREHWDRLTAMGCDTVQGYVLGRPMSGVELGRWLLDHRRRSARARTPQPLGLAG